MSMKLGLVLISATVVLAACSGSGAGLMVDRGFDSHEMSAMKAGIWIDPNGCDHWIIDDGVEGYLSQRLDRLGKPVCSGIGEPGTVVGEFRRARRVPTKPEV